MSSLPPNVIGPLSVCNKVVKIQGQVTGATVRIYDNGAKVAEGVATSADQVFSLDPGKSLHAGHSVTATQDQGDGESVPSPNPVRRSKETANDWRTFVLQSDHRLRSMRRGDWRGPRSDGRDYGQAQQRRECARLSCFAERECRNLPRSSNEAKRGSDRDADRERNRWSANEFPEAITTEKLLPTPWFTTVAECATSVGLSNVLPGAVVTVHRSSGDDSGCYVDTSFDMPVSTPLQAGEDLTVEQAFPTCDYSSPMSPTWTVIPNKTIGIFPWVNGPLCPGATSITVTQLVPSALIEILVGGASLGTAQVPNVTEYTFGVPPLAAGTSVMARLKLCETWFPSNTVQVTGSSGTAHPDIPTPVHECGGIVRANGVIPGAKVQVWSQELGAPIGEVVAFDTHVDVPVAPELIGGDHVHAVVTGCGAVKVASSKVLVQQDVKGLSAPTVKPPMSYTNQVTVEHVMVGAAVDLFVNGTLQGQKLFAVPTDTMTIAVQLQINDKVTARQRLCGFISPLSKVVSALPPPPPVAAFTATPSSGLAPLTVQFSNQSTGITVSFDWDFADGTPHSPDINPTHHFLNPNTYTVTLVAKGPAANSAPISHLVKAYNPTPTATFTASPTSGPATLTVHFTATPHGLVQKYEWNFGDGPSVSGGQTITHPYGPGTFHPSLTVSNDNPMPSTSQGPTITVTGTTVQPTILVSVTPGNARSVRQRSAGQVPGYRIWLHK